MNNLKSILVRIEETLHTLPQWSNLDAFVADFHQIWQTLGNQVQQELVQAQINHTETQYSSPRTKREKRYYTPLGEMVLVRRAYVTPNGLVVKVDEELGLPDSSYR